MDPTAPQGSSETTPNEPDNLSRQPSPSPSSDTPPSDCSTPAFGANRTPSPPDPGNFYAPFGPEIAERLLLHHRFMTRLIEAAEMAMARIERLEGEHRRLSTVRGDIDELLAALNESDGEQKRSDIGKKRNDGPGGGSFGNGGGFGDGGGFGTGGGNVV
ncbi:uncharacterized protein DFL_009688 [Arthrobotrys flagrans]|uniref:Uncharacterized protein n=1 Tax=Arthrobotrys flagrans TaxID=97331 RepID=A0A436ZSD5_ARTFL|nr:hypothetical protein DFL_009688 [Arthrobotrys flagrans]